VQRDVLRETDHGFAGLSMIGNCVTFQLTVCCSMTPLQLLRPVAQDCPPGNQLAPEMLNRAILNARERHTMSAERFRTQEATQESHAASRNSLDAAPDPIVIVDPQEVIVRADAPIKRMSGELIEGLTGLHRDFLRLIRARDRDAGTPLTCSTIRWTCALLVMPGGTIMLKGCCATGPLSQFLRFQKETIHDQRSITSRAHCRRQSRRCGCVGIAA
jgi:PAS domain-containing protein